MITYVMQLILMYMIGIAINMPIQYWICYAIYMCTVIVWAINNALLSFSDDDYDENDEGKDEGTADNSRKDK